MAVIRKPLAKPEAHELVAATRARVAAEERWERAVVEALRAGASMRQIAEMGATSHSTVQRLAKRAGWPDAKEQKRRAEEAAKRAEWRVDFERYLEGRDTI